MCISNSHTSIYLPIYSKTVYNGHMRGKILTFLSILGAYVVITVTIKMFRYRPEETAMFLICVVALFALVGFVKFLKNSPKDKINFLVAKFMGIRRIYRIVILSYLLWGISVLGVVYTFEPFGSYIHDSEWFKIFKICLIPPTIAIFGGLLFIKLTGPKNLSDY